ncbi:uncharacterized protein LOC143914724 [Arctopsyche grandis]|uniref:uncharacterized protein LOC143914724 n=1 Tax=Arctopsyche grandis TaxID=121162 RepID=UPI00406D76ED
MAQQEDICISLKSQIKAAVSELAKEMGLFDLEITSNVATPKGNNFSGDVYRIKVSGVRDDGKKDNSNFILKITNIKESESPDCYYLVHAYARETLTYTELFPIFDKMQQENDLSTEEQFRHATYHTGHNKSFEEFILLSDLTQENFKMVDKFEPLDYLHVTLVLKALAKFHALSFAMKQKEQNTFTELAKRLILMKTTEKFKIYSRLTIDMATQLAEDEMSKIRMAVFGETILEKWETMDDPTNMAPYNVLCHGDCWINNFMFKYKDDVPVDIRILDWQNLKPSSPVLDVVHMLSMSTDEDFRKTYFPKVFNVYYENLDNCVQRLGYNIEKIYPRSVYDDHLKEFFPVGLLIVINAFPFTMSDKDKIPELEKFITDHSGSLQTVKFSNRAKNRLRGLIRDYINLNYI